jgi:hypothetical protein
MEDRSGPPEEFGDFKGLIEYVGKSISSNDFDGFLKIKDYQNKSYHLRTLVEVWKEQQNQDRETRKYYAKWLLIVICLQIGVINTLFVLIGLGVIKTSEWTSNTFIVSVFAEISAMVLVVINYLFPKSKTASLKSLVKSLKEGGTE